MSDAGGPTLSKLPLQTPASYPDTSSDASEAESAGSGSEDASNSDVEGDAWDTVDDFRKAVFEELLSPVRSVQVPEFMIQLHKLEKQWKCRNLNVPLPVHMLP